jgi:hypothetical protein
MSHALALGGSFVCVIEAILLFLEEGGGNQSLDDVPGAGFGEGEKEDVG